MSREKQRVYENLRPEVAARVMKIRKHNTFYLVHGYGTKEAYHAGMKKSLGDDYDEGIANFVHAERKRLGQ